MSYPASDTLIPTHPVALDHDKAATPEARQAAAAAYYAAYGLAILDEPAMLLATILTGITAEAAAEVLDVLVGAALGEIRPDMVALNIASEANLITDEGDGADEPNHAQRLALQLWMRNDALGALHPTRWLWLTPFERGEWLTLARKQLREGQ